MSISLLSLGCPKNTADSEALVRLLRARGVGYTEDARGASVMLVNTCGFIEAAKRESIEEILRLARLKEGRRRLVVFGCLAERYREDLLREIPEIDAIFGVGQEAEIAAYLRDNDKDSSGGGGGGTLLFREGRPPVSAPLKVAEGCNRRCTFCAIPSIRGPQRSRAPEDILREAEEYVKAGVRELVLVAQDLTAFGRDLGGYTLPRLMREMASMGGEFWIRPMYLYPSDVDDGLLEVMAGEGKVCKYLDIPLQHTEDRILRLMGRRGTRQEYMALVRRARRAVPAVALRTALIVGFPGETEEDFQGMLDFVHEAAFEHLGAFVYSREEGTPAAALKGRVPAALKQRRMDALMQAQAGISLERNRSLLGRRMRVLLDEAGEGGIAVGRLGSQAPEVDGVVYVEGGGLVPGSFVDVEITGAEHYDLRGRIG